MSPGEKAFLIGLLLFRVGLGILIVASVALVMFLWVGFAVSFDLRDSVSSTNIIDIIWDILVPGIVAGALMALVGYFGTETDLERRIAIRKTVIGSVLIVSIALAAYGTWVVVTPKWTLSVTADKFSYALGENVTITVILENLGYIPHSITSSITNVVYVSITEFSGIEWTDWSIIPEVEKTTITVSPGYPLTKTIVWNQMNTYNPSRWNGTYKPGTYTIEACIPDLVDGNAVDPRIWCHPIFANKTPLWSHTDINVTAT